MDAHDDMGNFAKPKYTDKIPGVFKVRRPAEPEPEPKKPRKKRKRKSTKRKTKAKKK